MGKILSIPKTFTLHRDKVEPLQLHERITIETDVGNFEMTKSQFLEEFENVILSEIWHRQGSFTYLKVPGKAWKYFKNVA